MNIDRFENEDDKDAYLEWRKLNPQGFVLNINTWNPKSKTMKNIIHKASWCDSLDNPPIANRNRPITAEHPKLCSNNFHELESEMKYKELPYKPCGICKPKAIKLKDLN